ncbi:MAG: VIT1/CCC1 transporter family protein [Bacteroidota bacterium]|nr:VIT1/CCC1 transporter family protein [Bacteroidota bacterium]
METYSHSEQHFTSSDIIKDIVIGMSDGLTVPFALAAGLSGAVDSNGIILTAGIAEIAAGSIAMGLGGFMAGRTEVEHYENEMKREYYEVEHLPEKEKEEIKEIFENYGLDAHSQNQIVEALAKDKVKWVDFMMKFELGLDKPNKNRALTSALTIGAAYIVGGIIPLTGYYFTSTPLDGLIFSSSITLVCLLIFGWFKSKLIGQNPWKGALQVMLIGTLASAAAYIIARLITE